MKTITTPNIPLITEYLSQGRVVVLPTDTIYGLSCVIHQDSAVKKILEIKKRENKPLIILVASIKMAQDYAHINDVQLKYLEKHWLHSTRPCSLILTKKKSVSDLVTAGQANVALRLPKSEFLIKIIKQLDAPLVSTSLNISGEKHLENLENLDKYLSLHGVGARPDLVYNAGEQRNQASQVIDICDAPNIKILRK